MNDYKIISDGSCDISFADALKLDIDIIPFSIKFKTDEYKKEGLDIEVRKFYKDLVDNPNIFPKSSLPSVNDYVDIFKKYAKLNMDIICLCITSKFSGSYNAAINARNIVLEEYKDVKITVIDTTVNTVLQGLVVKEAVRLKRNGYSYDDLVKAINTHLESGRIFFTIKGLSYLKNGGRIGKVSSIIGDFLKVSPIITLKDGEIFSSGVAISRVRSLAKVKNLVANYLNEVKADKDSYILAVGYGYDIEEAKIFYEEIKKIASDYQIDFAQIGSTIAVHTGPYPLGVGILKRLDK